MPKNFALKVVLFSALLVSIISCNDQDELKVIDLSQKQKSQKIFETKTSPKLFVAVSSMISPVETFYLYRNLIEYISTKAGVAIEFKQRKTYEEVNDLLQKKQIDFAFICTGAYLRAKRNFPLELLVVPVVNGKATYQAYILASKQSGIKSFDDFEGKSFAFTDPFSKTGCTFITNLLKQKERKPTEFFAKTIFTYAHDYSIQAVERNIVDGATVDGLVYEYLKKYKPARVRDVVVIKKSEEYGIPPFVVQPDLNDSLKTRLRNIMLNMHNDPEGRELLNKIMIDKFVLGNDAAYKK